MELMKTDHMPEPISAPESHDVELGHERHLGAAEVLQGVEDDEDVDSSKWDRGRIEKRFSLANQRLPSFGFDDDGAVEECDLRSLDEIPFLSTTLLCLETISALGETTGLAGTLRRYATHFLILTSCITAGTLTVKYGRAADLSTTQASGIFVVILLVAPYMILTSALRLRKRHSKKMLARVEAHAREAVTLRAREHGVPRKCCGLSLRIVASVAIILVVFEFVHLLRMIIEGPGDIQHYRDQGQYVLELIHRVQNILGTSMFFAFLLNASRWIRAMRFTCEWWGVAITHAITEVGDDESWPLSAKLDNLHRELVSPEAEMNHSLCLGISASLFGVCGYFTMYIVDVFVLGEVPQGTLVKITFAIFLWTQLLFWIGSVGDQLALAKQDLIRPSILSGLANRLPGGPDEATLMVEYIRMMPVGFKLATVVVTYERVLALIASFMIGILFTFGPSIISLVFSDF